MQAEARSYLEALRQRVLVFDGSMGANLQELGPTASDFGGPAYEGCMDVLCITNPELPKRLHRGFLQVGCDVIESNTFQASRLRLAEWGLADKTFEINRAGARLARELCDEFEAKDGKHRFVAGAIGPSGLLPGSDDPTLSNITFDKLVEVFEEQAEALIAGGADLLIVETQQDILETKAVMHGARQAFSKTKRQVPLQVQVTLDVNGRMLLGTDVGAVLTVLIALDADVIGLNCSTGPEHMREPVRFLTQHTQTPISVIPNAGIPINLGAGKAHYPLEPHGLAESLQEFVRDFGVSIVGGCCGTTFEHMRQVVEAVTCSKRSSPAVERRPSAASAIRAFELRQDPPPTLVGERVNTQGSRAVKRLLLAEQYDDLRSVARAQIDGGAHLLDVCVALTERSDEAHQMQEVVKRLRSSVEAPLVIDSTEPDVLQTALETYPGPGAIVNSINLEGGRAKADRVLDLARTHGAAVISLTIDEQGMAHTAERKLEIAHRIYELARGDHGLPPEALIFDVLTFPVTTCQADLRDDAHQTIEGIRRVKQELPGVFTILGLSNVSFGISLAARGALNSVFLYHCVQAGLDLAIVNPVHLTPYAEVPAEQRALAEDLIYNRREDALPRFLAAFEGVEITSKSATSDDADLSTDERIHHHILHRQKDDIEKLIDEAIDNRQPLKRSQAAVQVLNDVLLPAMKDVGDRFGAGELILPFVLQSAEVMKRAVAHLEQYLEKQAGYTKGTIVVATVFGDVHDIGKSLLITILSNNGYTVHDLGKQVPANTIIDAAIDRKADAIGLSALLVSTSRQMPVCIQELDARGLHIPVLVGGAAINRAFGRRAAILPDGRLYEPGVFHCKDVFEGLATMDTLQDADQRESLLTQVRAETISLRDAPASVPAARVVPKPSAGPRRDVAIPAPATWGVQTVEASLPEVWQYLDKNTLFRHHWGGHRAKGAEYTRIVEEVFEPELARLQTDAVRDGWLDSRMVMGTFRCNSDGDALILWGAESREELGRFQFPRQASGDQLCLADYFRDRAAPEADVVVLQAVTVGPKAGEYIEELQRGGDYSRMLYVNGLASSTAEALAEFAHRAARAYLGLPENQGLRYSWGYQACPDLSQQRMVMDLLDAERLIGLRLSTSDHLDPEHSTAALVVHHPEAKYFAIRSEA